MGAERNGKGRQSDVVLVLSLVEFEKAKATAYSHRPVDVAAAVVVDLDKVYDHSWKFVDFVLYQTTRLIIKSKQCHIFRGRVKIYFKLSCKPLIDEHELLIKIGNFGRPRMSNHRPAIARRFTMVACIRHCVLLVHQLPYGTAKQRFPSLRQVRAPISDTIC